MTEKTWDKENMKSLSCRVRTEEAEAFRNICDGRGVSTHAMLLQFVRATINGDSEDVVGRENRQLREENRKLRADLRAMTSTAKMYKTSAENALGLVDEWLRRYDSVK